MVKHLLAPLLLSLLTALSPLCAAQQTQPLQAFVDRTNITINDVITLTLRLDVSMGNNRPALTGLNQSFEQVGGLSSRSTYTNTNGNIQAWTEYSLMLRPLTTGTLTIPAFRVGSQTTNPIQIKVTDAASNTNGANDEIFLRTTISKTESYVQQQLIFTIRIYYSIGFDQGAQLSAPQVENAVVQQLGTDNNFQEVVKGISYQVTERRFVMFPQKSGEFRIPPVLFNATIGRRGGLNFFSQRAPVREINLTGDSHIVNVKPQPDTFDGLTWLPASSLKLEENWSGDLAKVHVGEAVTRNFTITATGLSSSLLPAIVYKDIPGLRFYPDQPVRGDNSNADGVTGKRTDGTAIVASQPGDFLLPEVKLPWWNTTTDRMEYATLPAKTIRVLPALNAPDANGVSPGSIAPTAAGTSAFNSSAEPGGRGSNPLWISTTVLFAVLWAFTALLYLRSRQQLAYAETTGSAPVLARMPDSVADSRTRAAATPNAGVTLRVLKTACELNNLADIRKALLKWGQGSLLNPDLLTLEQLASACNDARLTTQLQLLDQALYGVAGGTNFDAKALYERVAALHKQGIKPTGSEDKFALRPLYKN